MARSSLILLSLFFSSVLSHDTGNGEITAQVEQREQVGWDHLSTLQQQQVERFQNYLRISTAHPKPDYATAVSFLSAIARSIGGLDVRVLEFSPSNPVLLVSWPGSDPSAPSLLLNSHMDSVPADASKWSYPPFAAHRDPLTGRIFARGAQDDKCLVIQHLEALRALRDSGFAPRRSVHVSIVPDEEVGGAHGAARFSASEEFRALNVGFVIDEGQASPGEAFRVFYADRTPWKLIVKASGQPGHGSRMYDGVAMENLMDTVEAVARFRDAQFDLVKSGQKPASEVISVNPVYLKAGTPSPTGFVMNVQPSEAEAGFDIRLPPTVDPDEMKNRIAEWAPRNKNMTYQIIENGPMRDINGHPLATSTDESNAWWHNFKQAVIQSGGKLAKPEVLASTTDARFVRQVGIPAIGFSPMSNTPILLHEHDEFLQDTVFLKGIKVFEHVIHSLTSFEGLHSSS